jgi:hypothetical protein
LTEGTARKLPGGNVPLQRQFLGKEISNLLANRLRKSLPLSSGSSSMPSNDARDVFSILQMLGRNRPAVNRKTMAIFSVNSARLEAVG